MRFLVKPNGYAHHHRLFPFPKDGREVIVNPAAKRDIDEKGKPLVLTTKSWEYIKEANGSALVIESLDPSEAESRIGQLEAELAAAKARIAELEKKK